MLENKFLFLGKEGEWIWTHSNTGPTDSFWGPNTPNTIPGNVDDCGVMIVQPNNFWWEDSNCFVPDVQQKPVATVCQIKGYGPYFQELFFNMYYCNTADQTL
jgi:hypothetical protein